MRGDDHLRTDERQMRQISIYLNFPPFGVKFDENGQNFAPEFKRIRKMIAIYFSSTGNTKHCMQRFIECLGRGIPPV